jgi:DNA-binding NarL/FixJ family response regulator
VKPNSTKERLMAKHELPESLDGPIAPTQPARARAHQRIRTLIADDSPAYRRVAGLLLAKLPAVEIVGAAADGVDVLAQVASKRPDLVLIDLQMPRFDGLHATRRIRAEFPGVRVIVTTLSGSEKWKAASAASGVDWFIPKECLPNELPGVIAEMFSGPGGAAEGEGG